MKTTIAIAARLFATAAMALAAHGAQAHASLLDSNPKDGAAVPSAPAEMRLKFNAPLEPAFSSLKLTGPDGKDVAVGKLQTADDDGNAVVSPLPHLGAGAYKAQWSAMGRDGHRTKGEVNFTVK